MQTNADEKWRFAATNTGFADYFHKFGFAVVDEVLSSIEVQKLISAITSTVGSGGYAKRNLLDAIPEVNDLAHSSIVMNLVKPVLGASAFPVKGILFDKTIDANWKVA